MGACLMPKVILSFGIPHSGTAIVVVLDVGLDVDWVVEAGVGDAVAAVVDVVVVEVVVEVVVVVVVGFTEQYHLSKWLKES